jgi:C-terminal processing protease CtpA/Prc
MLSDDIGYLRVTSEETNVFSDYYAYLTGNHKYAREKFRKDLRKLREQGMKKLVIDIRNNSGGYEEVATALTSLFTKEKMYAFSLGIRNKNKIKSVEDRFVYGDGEFCDLEIIVLTSMRCGSAGDGLSLYLSRLDNVTVAGLTNPSGINQEVGGYVYMPENTVITFPTGLVLDENGNPNIDIDDTRISRNPIDIKIPLNKESAIKIFNSIDYELEWAIEYLNS